jgi:hypothetical protein
MKRELSSSRVMLGQGTDSAVQLGFSSSESILNALKLNILFFDEVVFPGMQLIGSRTFFQLHQEDPSATKHLIGSGILRPQFQERDDDISGSLSSTVIAKRMIEARNVTGLSAEQMLSFSESLDSFHPRPINVKAKHFKTRSRSLVRSSLVRFCEINKQATDSNRLHSFIEYCDSAEYFSESELWRKAESETPNLYIPLATYISSATLLATSSLSMVELSTAKEQAAVLDGLPLQRTDLGLEKLEQEAFEIEGDVSFHALASLPFEEVFLLRDTPQFSSLRRSLQAIRLGQGFKARDIDEELKACCEIIKQYASENKIGRRSMLGDLASQSRRMAMRISIPLGLASVPLIEFVLKVPGMVSPFMLFASGLYAALETKRQGQRFSRSTVTSFETDGLVRAIDGAIIEGNSALQSGDR